MANPDNIRKLIDAKRKKEGATAAPPQEASAATPDATHADLVAYVRGNPGTKASDLMRIYKVSRNRAIAAVDDAARPAPAEALPGQTAIAGSGVEEVPVVTMEEVTAVGAGDGPLSPAEADMVERIVAEANATEPPKPAPLIGADPTTTQHMTRLISLALVDEHPANPRLLYPGIKELAADILENGLRDPIKVRPVGDRFEVFSGHRRLRAMREIGWTETVAFVEHLDDLAAYQRVVVENEHRADLTAIEEGIAFQGLIERGQTVEQAAKLVGKSPAHVYARMKLTALCADGRAAMVAGWLTPETGLLVARIPTEGLQIAALKMIGPDEAGGDPEPASYRQARDTIQREFMLVLSKAPFDRKDATLCPGVGACSDCPKRSSALPAEIRADLKGADICLDRDCHRAKCDADWSRRKAAAAEEKIQTIDASEAIQKHLVYTGDTLAEHNGICSLEATCHEDKDYRQWSKLLPKKAIPKPDVLVQSPITGAAIPGWKRETLIAAAVEAKALKPHAAKAAEDQKEKDAAERAKIRERKKVGGFAIALAVLQKRPIQDWPVEVWHAIADQVLEFQWGGPVAKRLGLEGYQDIAERIPKATIQQAADLTLHLVLQRALEHACMPHAGLSDKPLRAMLAGFGVTLEKAAEKMEAAEKEPASPAPAAKPKATEKAKGALGRKVASAKKAAKR